MPDLKDSVAVSYIWIGPPSNLPGSSGVVGHDVQALTELWRTIAKEKKHQVFFWCLDEFVPYYQNLLKDCLIGDNPINICSIEAYLQECMEKECVSDLFYEEEINHDALLVSVFFKLFLNREISTTPIADRVSCKELFSLFLLRSIGGFVLDTNVSLSSVGAPNILPKPEPSVKFMLPASYLFREFKHWMLRTNARLPWECFECWAMYSSGANEITIPMVRQFIELAGYSFDGRSLIKSLTLPQNVETCLKKEELDKYQASLPVGAAWTIRNLIQNVRGLPIMSTVTTCIRKSKEKKVEFFNGDPSAIKLIKIERDSEDLNRLIAPDLGVMKTYNNTHVLHLDTESKKDPSCGPG